MGPLTAAVRAVAGTAAAMLPCRWWPVLDDYVPASGAALPASILTLLVGAAVGITGFFAHLEASAAATNEVLLATATRASTGDVPLPSGLMVLSVFTFLFLTPTGWLASYLVGSGFVRAVGAGLDDPHGDFVLTLVDAAAHRTTRRVGQSHRTRRREQLEGPVIPDRIVPGPKVGLANAEIVIVAARPKEGWGLGTVVLSDRGEFRIAALEDRMIEGRLRHLYALTRHSDLEVFRKTVHYEFRV